MLPEDEWDAISLNYTSGTTGNPKGVVYHHRGAYLLAAGNLLAWNMPAHPVYLWTLPMFHCNGWCFPWSLSINAGTHVCLRKVAPETIHESIRRYRVTHLCGAPIVMRMIVDAVAQKGTALRGDRGSGDGGGAPARARHRRHGGSWIQSDPSLRPDGDLWTRGRELLAPGVGGASARRARREKSAAGSPLSGSRGSESGQFRLLSSPCPRTARRWEKCSSGATW